MENTIQCTFEGRDTKCTRDAFVAIHVARVVSYGIVRVDDDWDARCIAHVGDAIGNAIDPDMPLVIVDIRNVGRGS